MVWRFDYAGIAVLIMASFVPAMYYAFLCQPFWRHFYLWTTTAAGKGPGKGCSRGRWQQGRTRIQSQQLVAAGGGGLAREAAACPQHST
jgi:adiponectin receptor